MNNTPSLCCKIFICLVPAAIVANCSIAGSRLSIIACIQLIFKDFSPYSSKPVWIASW